MRRTLSSLLVAAVAFGMVATTVGAQPEIRIEPAAGSETDTFTVWGTGLPVGLAIEVNFVSPEGNVFTNRGDPEIVDEEGEFEYEVVPAEEFEGSSKGTWVVQVCNAGLDQCVQTTFNIN